MIQLIENLSLHGWSIQKSWLSPGNIAALSNKFPQWKKDNHFAPAKIGQGNNLQRSDTIRGDETWWFDQSSPPAELRELMKKLEELRIDLNRSLFLGLKDFEVHLASYPPGAGYQKHFDRHLQHSARKLSLILYLNQDWRKEDGGELVLYNREGAELTRILPEGGTLVTFLSEDFPHEVLPASRERRSLTGWFLDATRGVV